MLAGRRPPEGPRLGLGVGLCGVAVLLGPKLRRPAGLLDDPGPLLVLGSAAAWSLGSLVVRHCRPAGSHLAAAAYQMIIGGGALSLIGLAVGEARELTPDRLTPQAWFAFGYLLVVGSLVGFVAFNWLLGHVSATLVGTYAYVNPLIAVLVGWALGGEELTGRVLVALVVILSGVALVRTAGARQKTETPPVVQAAPRGASGFWQNVTAAMRAAADDRSESPRTR